MIARPHVPAPPPAVGALPRARRRLRLIATGHRTTALVARAAALVARDAADDPTRFSPDAWKAWDERGTL